MAVGIGGRGGGGKDGDAIVGSNVALLLVAVVVF